MMRKLLATNSKLGLPTFGSFPGHRAVTAGLCPSLQTYRNTGSCQIGLVIGLWIGFGVRVKFRVRIRVRAWSGVTLLTGLGKYYVGPVGR